MGLSGNPMDLLVHLMGTIELHPHFVVVMISNATLALGSWPKQGITRLQAKKEARESWRIPPRMHENVRE